MKVTTTTTTRLSLTKEERPIAKSWGRWWNYMGQLERKQGFFRVIKGDWSGYRSSQYQITHIDYCFYKDLPNDFHGTVRFTDGTTMTVWVEKTTRAEIICKKLKRRANYTELIGKLIKSGSNFYDVEKKTQTT